jgi:Tfp pilus assembly protein PilV
MPCVARHVRIRRDYRTGFTLIEAAIAIVIVGLGVVALMQLVAACTLSNQEGLQRTISSQLAAEMRERAASVAFDALPATFNNRTFSPPIDATGRSMTELPNWSQSVVVTTVNPADLTATANGTARARRVTVTVQRAGKYVHTATWVQFEPSN